MGEKRRRKGGKGREGWRKKKRRGEENEKKEKEGWRRKQRRKMGEEEEVEKEVGSSVCYHLSLSILPHATSFEFQSKAVQRGKPRLREIHKLGQGHASLFPLPYQRPGTSSPGHLNKGC